MVQSVLVAILKLKIDLDEFADSASNFSFESKTGFGLQNLFIARLAFAIFVDFAD